jgi:DNA modification methylase
VSDISTMAGYTLQELEDIVSRTDHMTLSGEKQSVRNMALAALHQVRERGNAFWIHVDQDNPLRSVARIKIGPHTLYLGDAYTIRPQLGWFDADVTDPPYEFVAEGGGKYQKGRERGGAKQIVKEGLNKGFDHRIINPLLCGSVFVFCHNDQISKLSTYLDGNFDRFVLLTWKKKNPQPVANKHYQPDREFYIHAWNAGYHPVGTLDQKKREVTASSLRGKAKEEMGNHPTIKPDEVMDKIMANANGQTVCDAFMGTGSTGVAAIKAGKTFTGIEHNPKHFETALRRIEAAFEAASQHPSERTTNGG